MAASFGAQIRNCDIETLVILKNGNEKKVYTQGIINESAMLSATRNRIVWNEYRFDPRWQVRNYSAVVGYDLESKMKRVIAKKGRYASAAISPDGYKVATIETDLGISNQSIGAGITLVAVFETFDNANNDFISMPRWTSDGKEIVALLTNKKGKAIVNLILNREEQRLFLISQMKTSVIPFNLEITSCTILRWAALIIFMRLTSIRKRFQITCSKYGAYNPMVTKDGKNIYYNNQGRDGMDVVKIPFDPSSWKPWTQRDQPQHNFGHLVEQEGRPSVLNNLQQQHYETKRYHRWKGWLILIVGGELLVLLLLQLLSGLLPKIYLSTTTISAGYQYDNTEKTGAWKAAGSYQGW